MKTFWELLCVIALTVLGAVCLVLVFLRWLAWDWWHEKPDYWGNQ